VNEYLVADTFDAYASNLIPSDPIPLGVFIARDGKRLLRAELVGTNPQTGWSRFLAGLDAVVVSE
jgi:hypothetical protein